MSVVPAEPLPRRVTIDGPPAAGTTTLAMGLAETWSTDPGHRGTVVLDTRLTYVAAAWVLSREPDLTPTEFTVRFLHLPALWHGTATQDPKEPLVLMWDDQPIADRLHREEAAAHLPLIEDSDLWRDPILAIHTNLMRRAAPYDAVAVGRDTGITQEPAPDLAVYLTADTPIEPETPCDVRVQTALAARPRTLRIDTTHLPQAAVRARVLDALAHDRQQTFSADGTGGGSPNASRTPSSLSDCPTERRNP
ncbi:hypothetical protein ACFZBU_39365 [Embleya sp. NPDC008237]|uniref:hypothetical protein n=1 Tax=Embleya sp. NPDC008237 TaxID=3363978 RepID=UPI0036E382CA